MIDWQPRWKKNLDRDVGRLKAERHLRRVPDAVISGPAGTSRRPSRREVIALMAGLTEYMMLRKAQAWPPHGTAAQSAVNTITNVRTGTEYQFLPDALATMPRAGSFTGGTGGALAGDTILMPAGAGHTYLGTFYPYNDYRMLGSSNLGYTNGDGWDSMTIGSLSNLDGSTPWTPSNLTIQGTGSANNGRAQFVRPYGTLVAPLNPGDTIIQLDSVAAFPSVLRQGFNNTVAGLPQTNLALVPSWNQAATFSGIDTVHNYLTGVTNTLTLPIGTIMMNFPEGTNGPQALVYCWGANPGFVFTNIEMWGASSYQGNCCALKFGNAAQAVGSATLNNCYIHDSQMGMNGGYTPIGAGVALELYETEIFRCGASGQTHNIYWGSADEFIFQNSYSHFTTGAHLVKSRARTNYILYSRITGEQTTTSPGNNESSNIDLSNGGLSYVIGCQFEQSPHATQYLMRYCAEGGGSAWGSSTNPTQELYFVNNTCVGGTGGTTNYSIQFAFVNINSLGVQPPEQLTLTQTAGGALSARTYFATASCTTSGSTESTVVIGGPSGYLGSAVASFAPSPPAAGFTAGIGLAVNANELLVVQSPQPRTGANGWNLYLAYADPLVYSTAPFGQHWTANYWWYDATHTLPILAQTSGGTQPTTNYYVGVTYQFAQGESLNGATLGNLSGQYNAAIMEVTTGNTLVVNSPPAYGGATGWNVYVVAVTWSAQSGYSINGIALQNASPIAIGTNWTMPAGGPRADTIVTQTNWFKQNASPLTIGTNWTEPTSGLANHNRPMLRWFRRAGRWGQGQEIEEWYAIAASALTGYNIVINAGSQFAGSPNGAIAFGVTGANTTLPFDANASLPVARGATVNPPAAPATISTSAGNTMVVGGFNPGGAAGSGFTLIGSGGSAMAEYLIESSPQTNLVVGLSTNQANQNAMIADALVQASGGTLTLDGSAVGVVSGYSITCTLTTANAGDVIVLVVNPGAFPANGVDSALPYQTAFTGSPTGLVQNNLAEYFVANGSENTGVITTTGYLTLASNLVTNYSTQTFGGPPFVPPAPGFVSEAGYNYNLTSGSVAVGLGTPPGSSPEGYALTPIYKLNYSGLPTPGAPIPALVSRATANNLGAFE